MPDTVIDFEPDAPATIDFLPDSNGFDFTPDPPRPHETLTEATQQAVAEKPFVLRSAAAMDAADARAGMEALSTLHKTTSQPLWNPELFKPVADDTVATKAEKALYNTGAGILSSFTSPEMMAALPLSVVAGAGRAVSAVFSAQMIASIPEAWARVQEADKTPAWSQERMEAGLNMLTLGVFTKATLGHFINGKAPVRPDSASEPAPITEPRATEQAAAEPPLPQDRAASRSESPPAVLSPDEAYVSDAPVELSSSTSFEAVRRQQEPQSLSEPQPEPIPPEPPVQPERWQMPDPVPVGTEASIAELNRQLGPKEAPPASEILQPSREAEPAFGSRFVADMGLGIQASQVPGFETVVKPWIESVKGFVEGARSAVQFAKVGPQRDMVAAKFDAANNMAGMVARQARRHVELAGSETRVDPTSQAVRQQAATFVRQANGDKAGMLAKLDAIKGKGFDTVIEYAKRNWDELEPVAAAAKQGTDAAFKEAEAAGVTLDYRDNYVKGAYDFPAQNKVVFDDTSGGRGTGTSFKKAKVFNDYAEAIAAGFKPRELRLDLLSESAVNSTLRAVNRKKWAQSLSAIEMPDGLPATVEAKPNGSAPQGYRMVQVTPGNLMPLHVDIAPTIEALTRDSSFPRLLAHTSAFIKHNMLVFDIFHGSRFGQMQAAFERRIPSYQKGLSLLEFADADLSTAVKHGLVTPKEAAWASVNRPKLEQLVQHGLNVGRISDAIYSDVVPLMPGAKQANKFIFEKLSRGVITQSAVQALERNARLHPDWAPEKLNRYTAKEVNTYYRNLGNQGIFKSKTFQDAARFFVFAPQWIEGLVRSEARGYGQAGNLLATGKLGNIGAGMTSGLIAYFGLTQLVNMMTRGQPTWQNSEPGHKFDAWIPDFIQGSGGFFISPLSVFAETTHDAMKYAERGLEPLDVASQLATNKLHPQIRALRDLFGGKDFFGRPLYGWERVEQAAKDMAPVPLFAKTGGYKGGAERQLLSTLGIKATAAPTATNNIYQLAAEFRKHHGIVSPGDKGQFIESDYAGLRRALQNGDMELARTELDDLLKTKKPSLVDDYFEKYPRKPLSGSVARETGFKASLDRSQLEIYNASVRERQEIANLYRRLKSR